MKDYLTGQWTMVSNNSAFNRYPKLTEQSLEKFITGLPSMKSNLIKPIILYHRKTSDISRLKYHFIDSDFFLHRLTWL